MWPCGIQKYIYNSGVRSRCVLGQSGVACLLACFLACVCSKLMESQSLVDGKIKFGELMCGVVNGKSEFGLVEH